MRIQIELQHIEDITGAQLRKLPTTREENIYSPDGVGNLEEDEVITPIESGFMLGYLSD